MDENDEVRDVDFASDRSLLFCSRFAKQVP
jgi:hypothetical protein